MTDPRPRLDRRSFLRGGFLGSRPAGPSLFAKTPPVHRPPGAAPEREFLRDCTRCTDCADACPHHAIVPAGARFREAAGTPMIAPPLNPCRMCADTPCVTACATGALSPAFGIKMGTALVQADRCLPFCTVCAEQCPVPGAMRITARGVEVDAGACTGCGVCVYACPAPNKPVLVLVTTA